MRYFVLLFVVFWNVENFFDWTDNGAGESDSEFSSGGTRRWTRGRFFRKCTDISKTIFWIADSCGRMPEVIAFAEVENRSVLRRLISSTALSRYDYGIVHYDSPDKRGIDVGLLYDRSALDLTSSRPVPVPGLRTRDMLVATFIPCVRVPVATAGGDVPCVPVNSLAGAKHVPRVSSDSYAGRTAASSARSSTAAPRSSADSIAVIVCHHPSKYGGRSSDAGRSLAVKTLLELSDSLTGAGWGRQVIVGDFNDTPESEIYLPLRERLICLSDSLSARGVGSIRFSGVWELIDQAYVSKDLGGSVQEVMAPPWLTVPDSSYPGVKPFRTYQGPRYIGGVSDHYPILVRLRERTHKR